MSADRDARRVSSALTDARTVLSRAETALADLRRYPADPATPEIIRALEATVDALDPFRRIRGGCPNCGSRTRHEPSYNAETRRYRWPCEVPA